MRRAAVSFGLLGALATAAVALAAPPPGATARCADGTYSESAHHSGTCSHHGGVAAWLDGSTATPAAVEQVKTGGTVPLAPRRADSGCARGARPDRRCSPGAYYAGLTKAVICSPSFRTAQVRNVPESEKFAVEREYGLAAKPYGRTLEIDHIVPLELGGSNDISNLFPEPGSGTESYHVKDKLENALHALVCDGQVDLQTARRQIAENWLAAARRLTR